MHGGEQRSLCQSVARFIENRIRIPTEYVTGIPWQERERLFDDGEIQVLWLCGLPYVEKADAAKSGVELLAVPIPRGERYQARPVYFSDVIVRRDRPFRSFFELRGATWAYNEPRSHSGFNVVRAYLGEFGQVENCFGSVVETGEHAASVEMVLAGRVDGTAVDSTVLEWLIAQQAGLARKLRVVDTMGPSPIPPWVISHEVPPALRADLRALLLEMHNEPFGRAMLEGARLERFVAAKDSDYDAIRTMAQKAARVTLGSHT